MNYKDTMYNMLRGKKPHIIQFEHVEDSGDRVESNPSKTNPKARSTIFHIVWFIKGPKVKGFFLPILQKL